MGGCKKIKKFQKAIDFSTLMCYNMSIKCDRAETSRSGKNLERVAGWCEAMVMTLTNSFC